MSLLPQAQRLLDIIEGRPADRVPNFEFFFGCPAVVEHFLGRPSEDTLADRVEFAERIGWGSVVCGGFGYRLGGRNEVASDGTSHYCGGDAITWQQVEEWQPPDPRPAAEQFAEEAPQIRARGLMAHFFILHCFHSAATGIGLERLALMCYEEPELLKAYMARVEEFNRRALRAVLDTGERPDFVIFDSDCAFKNAMMVSPDMYRELVFEPTAATCAVMREAGIPYLSHTDGKIDQLYPIWIELGIQGAHGVEAQANDLGEIKRLFGDRFTLFGNMDPVFLAWATPEEVELATEKMVRTGAPGGRYGAAVNTIVSDYTPLENYLAFLRAIERVGVYESEGTLAL